jgi:hypothetical protein
MPAPCLHGPLREGGALVVGCDPCVDEVTAFDPFCAEWAWDWVCVDEAAALCSD